MTLSDLIMGTDPLGKKFMHVEDVKAFIKEMEDYAYDEDFIKIRVKDVPKHMVGHDLTWLDKHLARIRTKYLNKLRKKAGDKLI